MEQETKGIFLTILQNLSLNPTGKAMTLGQGQAKEGQLTPTLAKSQVNLAVPLESVRATL